MPSAGRPLSATADQRCDRIFSDDNGKSKSNSDSVAIPAFGFSRYSPALSLPAVKGEVEGPLFTRHFFVACPLPTIPHGISLSLGDSVAIPAFGFSRHTPLAPRHCNSNRHKHGLEMPVTPCVINTNVVSNRHRFGGVRLRHPSANSSARRRRHLPGVRRFTAGNYRALPERGGDCERKIPGRASGFSAGKSWPARRKTQTRREGEASTACGAPTDPSCRARRR
jgi:hypothetical protein